MFFTANVPKHKVRSLSVTDAVYAKASLGSTKSTRKAGTHKLWTNIRAIRDTKVDTCGPTKTDVRRQYAWPELLATEPIREEPLTCGVREGGPAKYSTFGRCKASGQHPRFCSAVSAPRSQWWVVPWGSWPPPGSRSKVMTMRTVWPKLLGAPTQNHWVTDMPSFVISKDSADQNISVLKRIAFTRRKRISKTTSKNILPLSQNRLDRFARIGMYLSIKHVKIYVRI
jgi:hypothetical protein